MKCNTELKYVDKAIFIWFVKSYNWETLQDASCRSCNLTKSRLSHRSIPDQLFSEESLLRTFASGWFWTFIFQVNYYVAYVSQTCVKCRMNIITTLVKVNLFFSIIIINKSNH